MVIFLLYGFFWFVVSLLRTKGFEEKQYLEISRQILQHVGFFTKVFETFVFWLVLNFLGVFCSVGSNKLSNLEKEIIQFSKSAPPN